MHRFASIPASLLILSLGGCYQEGNDVLPDGETEEPTTSTTTGGLTSLGTSISEAEGTDEAGDETPSTTGLPGQTETDPGGDADTTVSGDEDSSSTGDPVGAEDSSTTDSGGDDITTGLTAGEDSSTGDPTGEPECSLANPCGGGDYCVEGVCEAPPTGMVAVPAGSFMMGCNAALDADCAADELPYHEVTLDAYAIDRTEVTTADYTACIDDGGCPAPSFASPFCTYGDPSLDDHPMNCVDYFDASAYCSWAGKRLPTEAEWEKAARGTEGDIYPWGNSAPSCLLCVYAGCATSGPQPVGSKPGGASPYGALDMSGNLWEWTDDWYSASYYVTSPAENPTGPAFGSRKVLRGAASNYFGAAMRASFRGNDFEAPSPDDTHDGIGFRCASTP